MSERRRKKHHKKHRHTPKPVKVTCPNCQRTYSDDDLTHKSEETSDYLCTEECKKNWDTFAAFAKDYDDVKGQHEMGIY
jgi:hypothetical protein